MNDTWTIHTNFVELVFQCTVTYNRNFIIMVIPVTKLNLCVFEMIQSRIEFGNIIWKLLCSYGQLDTSDDCILYLVFWQRLQKSKLCAEAAIMDEMMLQRCLQFYSLLADYVLRIAEPENKGYIFFLKGRGIGVLCATLLTQRKCISKPNKMYTVTLVVWKPLTKVMIQLYLFMNAQS